MKGTPGSKGVLRAGRPAFIIADPVDLRRRGFEALVAALGWVPGIEYSWAGDKHGRLTVTEPGRLRRFGEWIEFPSAAYAV